MFILLLIIQLFVINYLALSISNLAIISIDGFRYDFLNETTTPFLWSLANNGIFSNEVAPVFPSITFPNHQSMITGLGVEQHGIVANRMVILNPDGHEFERFFFKGNKDPFWWDYSTEVVPIYIANEMNDISRKSASVFWPGANSIYQGRQISKFYPFDSSVNGEARLKLAESLIEQKTYNLVVIYLDEVDKAGHAYGPDSIQYLSTIKMVDTWIKGFYYSSLKDNFFNLIVAGDHGFSQLDPSKQISEEDLFSGLDVTFMTYGAVITLFPKVFSNHTDMISKSENIVNTLNSRSLKRFTAYLKEDVPIEFHYSKNVRIPPVVVIMNDGFYFYKGYDKEAGSHGWPVEFDKNMKTIFIANGPEITGTRKIGKMKITDVFGFACDILKISQTCFRK